MKLLHTSDWHLGRSLFGRKQHAQHQQFLQWLLLTIINDGIDVLLIAGDIFDSVVPSPAAQELYYDFLYKISHTSCKHVVIIAGNHDCPALLDAPQALLKKLSVWVVGVVPSDPAQCVKLLTDHTGQSVAVVCAVPYLRQRDVRLVDAEESVDHKAEKYIKGIHAYYAKSVEVGKTLATQHGVPLVAMGHLFATGGCTVEQDGVRTIAVGGVESVPLSIFSDQCDYVALGHLHIAQTLNRVPLVHYCGSPIAMGFGEMGQNKSVAIVHFLDQNPPVLVLCSVPVFQQLASVQGNVQDILQQCQWHCEQKKSVWLQVILEGYDQLPTGFLEDLQKCVQDSQVEILKIKRLRPAAVLGLTAAQNQGRVLEELSAEHVFTQLLNQQKITQDEQNEVMPLFLELLQSVQEKSSFNV